MLRCAPTNSRGDRPPVGARAAVTSAVRAAGSTTHPHRALAAPLSILVFLAVAGPICSQARAASDDLTALSVCNSGSAGAAANHRIEACTALIASGQFGGDQLAGLLVRRGNLYGAAENLPRALADFGKAIELNPGDKAALLGHAVTQAKLGRFDQAVSDASRAIAIDPDDADAYFERGFAYAQLADYRDAIADEAQVIRVDPSNARAYDNRCFYRAILGEALDRALADCATALSLRPNDPTVLGALGFTYLRAGQAEQAAAAYSAALQLDPGRAFLLFGRGLSEQRTGDAVGGVIDMTQAAAAQPNIAHVYERYGLPSR